MKGNFAMNPAAARLPIAESFLIQQDWSIYTPDQHAVWAELVSRRMPQLEEHACAEYLDGFDQIGLREDAIPNLAEVNKRLGPRRSEEHTSELPSLRHLLCR